MNVSILYLIITKRVKLVGILLWFYSHCLLASLFNPKFIMKYYYLRTLVHTKHWILAHENATVNILTGMCIFLVLDIIALIFG